MNSKEIFNIGVDSFKVDLFEGQYVVPNGMAYNSYLILDEKVAVLDTIDASLTSKWLDNLKEKLNGREVNYLIISHMEPDHSGSIKELLKLFPNIQLVGNAKTFILVKQFLNIDLSNSIVVKENDTLCLGKHTLQFIFATMVHWPEVMFSYDKTDKILFSADAFGKFGVSTAGDNWFDEAKRYYYNIVGKYGVQVQNVLKKVSAFEISTICPLHGCIIENNLEEYISKYDTWSSYKYENEGVFIAYSSIYGNTKSAVMVLRDSLVSKGINVDLIDLARSDISVNLSKAFEYKNMVLATTTYDGDIFPAMKHFLDKLLIKNYQNRNVALIENGSWAPLSGKIMKEYLLKMKNIQVCDTMVTIKSSLAQENFAQIESLANELASK